MLLIALIVETKLVRLNPESSPISQYSIAQIIASWLTGLEFRKCIRFTRAANALCNCRGGANGCSVPCPQRIHAWIMNISAEGSKHYSSAADFAALIERRYSGSK